MTFLSEWGLKRGVATGNVLTLPMMLDTLKSPPGKPGNSSNKHIFLKNKQFRDNNHIIIIIIITLIIIV